MGQVAELRQTLRVAGIRVASKEPLYGHTDMDSAFVVDDYPYGFNKRCKIRYWLESTPKKGFRFVSQTENPKTMRWNAPKKSTYALIAACLYKDDQDHVTWDQLNEYSDPVKALEFVKSFPRADLRTLKAWSAVKAKKDQAFADGSAYMTMNGVRQPTSEAQIGEHLKNAELWQEVLKRI
jgi:hypothetical protein